jgi:serine/threonine-protein kinase PpkA
MKKLLAIIGLVILSWCILSVILQSTFSQQMNQLPRFLTSATSATASLFFSPKPKIVAKLAQNSAQSSLQTSAFSSAASNANQLAEQSSQQASSQASSPAPTYALNIKVIPDDARIRLLNIPDKYKDGIALVSGRYNIEITKTGYKTKTEWIEIKNEPISISILLEAELDPNNPAKATIPNIVYGGKNSPALIRIPAGSFTMGDDSNMHSAPAHKVTISKAFAISKYEITFAEYDFFAQSANKPLPGDNGWGREDRPVIHVSWDDAVAYAQWLSKTTGKKFRLPTEAEWEYVARANTTTNYWWGDNEQDAKGKANCRRGCSSNFSGLFGSKTAPVGSYMPNAFGIYDTAGNVSEWVQDCYQDNYRNASSTGSAFEEKQCAGRVVRGGSTKDNVQHLISSARDNIPAGYLTETLGFRLVMELN